LNYRRAKQGKITRASVNHSYTVQNTSIQYAAHKDGSKTPQMREGVLQLTLPVHMRHADIAASHKTW
jgi:hypothetical protein